MLLSNIKLLQGAILIQPTQEATSSFSTETKKYDRKAIGIIKGISDADIFPLTNQIAFHEGDKVIFDDSQSIDFTIDGVALSIIYPTAIVAIIKEDK
jgi:co-chaperonin GroES (HSP10)